MIAIDCEMGGIGLEYSLLQAYFGIYDPMFRRVDELDLHIKHDIYNVSAQGMAVNKIQLPDHDLIAEYKTIAGKKLRDLLVKYSDNGSNKLQVVGHNVSGDLGHIWQGILNRETFQQFVSYRLLDTEVIQNFQRMQGLLPDSVSGSLESLGEFYNVPVEGTLHTARTDALLTIGVLQRQLNGNN